MYNPPKNPKHRRAYDLAWIEEQARDHHKAQEYLPPQDKGERLAYDLEWDRQQAREDYHS